MRTRILILGTADRGDDAAALALPPQLPKNVGQVVVVGQRDVLDHLEPDAPTVLVDVMRTGLPAGTVMTWSLPEVLAGTRIGPHGSTHSLSIGPALRLWIALGGRLPPGAFVGIEGYDYTRGAPISAAVRASLDPLREAVVAAAGRWSRA